MAQNKNKEISDLKRKLAEKKEYTFRVQYEEFMNDLVESTEIKLGDYIKYNLKSMGFIQFEHVKEANSNIYAYLDKYRSGGLINQFINFGIKYADIKFDISPNSQELPVLDFLVLLKMVSDNYSKYFYYHGPEWKLNEIKEDAYYKEKAYCDYLTCSIVKNNNEINCKHVHRHLYQTELLRDTLSDREVKDYIINNFFIMKHIRQLRIFEKITNKEYREIEEIFYKTKWDIHIDNKDLDINDIREMYRIIETEVITKHPKPIIIKEFTIKKKQNEYVAKAWCGKFKFSLNKVKYEGSIVQKKYGKYNFAGVIDNYGYIPSYPFITYSTLLPEEIFAILSAIEHYKTIEK